MSHGLVKKEDSASSFPVDKEVSKTPFETLLFWGAIFGIMGIVFWGWRLTLPVLRMQTVKEATAEQERLNSKSQLAPETSSVSELFQTWKSEVFTIFQKNLEQRIQEESQRAEDSVTDVNPSDALVWKHATYAALELTLEYPATWFLSIDDPKQQLWVRNVASQVEESSQDALNSASVFNITVFENPEQRSAEDWFLSHQAEYSEFSVQKMTTVAGLPGLSVEFRDDILGCKQGFFVVKKASIYHIAWCFATEDDASKDRPVMEVMMSRLKWLP